MKFSFVLSEPDNWKQSAIRTCPLSGVDIKHGQLVINWQSIHWWRKFTIRRSYQQDRQVLFRYDCLFWFCRAKSPDFCQHIRDLAALVIRNHLSTLIPAPQEVEQEQPPQQPPRQPPPLSLHGLPGLTGLREPLHHAHVRALCTREEVLRVQLHQRWQHLLQGWQHQGWREQRSGKKSR